MQPEKILEHPAVVLTEEQRHFYFDNGYVAIPSAISAGWLERLSIAVDEVVVNHRHQPVGVVDLLEELLGGRLVLVDPAPLLLPHTERLLLPPVEEDLTVDDGGLPDLPVRERTGARRRHCRNNGLPSRR